MQLILAVYTSWAAWVDRPPEAATGWTGTVRLPCGGGRVATGNAGQEAGGYHRWEGGRKK